MDHHRGILTMTKIEEGDTGPYICMAENNAGTKEIVANVEVIIFYYYYYDCFFLFD